ncbi:hypothetical protein ACFQMH_37170 [Streptomyces viridiviolaceus]|uniref:Uncharacterized protein n=1 Tax=Streptomyces viridiviolaceus TaxID=68282 RepID=A0ABW2EG69_9ACTN|nr:hypothetical protein [Streptomyces viridiviolaceus]
MDGTKHVCPSCGQAVETVVRRHKTLGAWVPVWVPGPCRNPACEARSDESAEAAETGEDKKDGGSDTRIRASRPRERATENS